MNEKVEKVTKFRISNGQEFLSMEEAKAAAKRSNRRQAYFQALGFDLVRGPLSIQAFMDILMEHEQALRDVVANKSLNPNFGKGKSKKMDVNQEKDYGLIREYGEVR